MGSNIVFTFHPFVSGLGLFFVPSKAENISPGVIVENIINS